MLEVSRFWMDRHSRVQIQDIVIIKKAIYIFHNSDMFQVEYTCRII